MRAQKATPEERAAKRAEQMRRYKAAHREELAAYHRAYREKLIVRGMLLAQKSQQSAGNKKSTGDKKSA